MSTTIILKDYVKIGLNGRPYKRQPIHPAVKFEKVLKSQRIPYEKTVKKYCDIEHLNINISCGGGWQSSYSPLFKDTTLPGTKCIQFNY